MSRPLTLMAVHAHPDDEAIYTGGTLLYYAGRGARTVLVTCTMGEAGPGSADGGRSETRAGPRGEDLSRSIAEERERELRCSMELLGVSEFHYLGYRDSGLLGWQANDHPRSFHGADFDGAAKKLVAVVRRERPHVLVTYDERGGYAHPDHVKAHLITVAAFKAAGDPEAYPDAGDPWQPKKLYYVYQRPGVTLDVYRAMRERGLKTPLDAPGHDPGLYVEDGRARTVLRLDGQLEDKLRAVQCHRTQANVYRHFLELPPGLLREFAGSEWFILAESLVGYPAAGEFETDLFARIR